ncbi:MAG: acetylglutamate kinase [Actinomycetota bacterium]|nr:acetylglutamate kinase [Actinomycetota bacterium]
MQKMIEKAGTLIEALPFIKKFSGKTFVIKYGGAAQVDGQLKEAFAQDIVLLNYIGIHPVIVHGGGPKISEMMKKLGKEPAFIHGQRVTDAETMDIVEMVLGGLINKEIVALINTHGGKAIGLSGKDGFMIKAEKKLTKKRSPETGEDEIIDLGLVGQVKSIDPEIVIKLQKEDFVTVVSPIGIGPHGETLNINADYVASAVASALQAEKLILVTDVPGVKDKETVIPSLNARKALGLIDKGTVSGGMIPKVQACLQALEGGVGKTHIVDGRQPHCLLLEIFTNEGVGTEIVG